MVMAGRAHSSLEIHHTLTRAGGAPNLIIPLLLLFLRGVCAAVCILFSDVLRYYGRIRAPEANVVPFFLLFLLGAAFSAESGPVATLMTPRPPTSHGTERNYRLSFSPAIPRARERKEEKRGLGSGVIRNWFTDR